MRIDIEFTCYLAVYEDRNHDLRLGFERAGKVPRIGINIVHHYGLAGRRGSTADSLVQWDAGVGCRRAFEGSQHQHVAAGLPFEHVKADPVVTAELLVEQRHKSVHKRSARTRRLGESVKFWDQIQGFRALRRHEE